ncbi:hypothetical protein TNCV_2395891 [Trichonephila clavipes]|nr:hypothetical protein TNCV_2395891 [Trichonephila clavipes]
MRSGGLHGLLSENRSLLLYLLLQIRLEGEGSSFLVHGTTPNGGVDGRAEKGNTRNGRHYPKCSSARRLRMVREDTEPLVKFLPVPGWRPMKQLAVRVHFLLCGGLLDDWSVEGVMSLDFV